MSRPALAALVTLTLSVAAPAQGVGVGVGVGGVSIDARGVLAPVPVEGNKFAERRRADLAARRLPADLNRPAERRCVSLPGLERAFAATSDPADLPESVKYLAGLTRIDAVLLVPAAADGSGGDIVVVGPAGGFAADDAGRVLSTANGRPVLRLDDLAVALRASRQPVITCSIDPVPERQAAMARAVANLPPARSIGQAKAVYQRMADLLGEQTVRLVGVPPESHFARTLVEADYRMKLVSIGLEPAGVRGVPSHLDLIRPGGNSTQRWWFVPAYDPFTTDGDRTAYGFAGPRAKVLSAEEVVTAGGRVDAGRTRESTMRWARGFSENFAAVAEAKPVFAELQNLFDLAVLAALLVEERVADRANWRPDALLDDARLPIASAPAPRFVQSAFNTKTAGRSLVIGLVGGGVELRPSAALKNAGLSSQPSSALAEGRSTIIAAKPADAWWWDATP